MKHNEIEQAVKALCDAVPEFTYMVTEDVSVIRVGTFTSLVEIDELACIAQRVKHYAAQQGWVPLAASVMSCSLCLMRLPNNCMDVGICKTEWLKFDPTQLGSEELHWIRAVKEMANITSNQGAPK